MTETTQDNDQLSRFFRKILIAFTILGLTMAATVYYVYTTSENNKEALCAYRGDLESRIATGEQFLKENPNGIPGIPAKTLAASLSNQKQAAKAFRIVNCP